LKIDACFFIHRLGAHTIFLLVYVDDIIMASSSSRVANDLITTPRSDFTVNKDLGDLHSFVGERGFGQRTCRNGEKSWWAPRSH
jgi:hypothetical protein